MSPILAFSGEPPGTGGLVGKLTPVQFEAQFAKVRRCILSSFTSLPTSESLVPFGSISAAGLPTDVYTSVPSFDATIETTILPLPAVAVGLVDGIEPSSSKKPTHT